MTTERSPSLTSVSRNRTEEKRAAEHWHVPGRDERTLSLGELRAMRAEPPGQVLSAYVDADARQGASRNPGWWIGLKDALSSHLERMADRDEATAFARLGAWLLERLQEEMDPGSLRRGLALYATETPRRLEVLVLPLPMHTELFWTPQAWLEPLERLLAQHPTTGIAVLDGWHARFLTSWLGTPIEERVLERTDETEDWREMKGTAATDLLASGATHRDRYQARMREHDERWWRDLVPHAQRYARIAGWQALAVAVDPHLGLDPEGFASAARVPLAAHVAKDLMHEPSGRIAELVARESGGGNGDADRAADQPRAGAPNSTGRTLPKK